MKPSHFRPWIPVCCLALPLVFSGDGHWQSFAALRRFQVHRVPGEATMDEVFPFHHSCLGLHLDDGQPILHVASPQTVASLDLVAMHRKELGKLKEVLENPKCIKVGVNLTKLIRAVSSTESDLGAMLPEDFSSWVDLSEFLWAHSITSSRPSWTDLLQLQPTADLVVTTTGCAVAMA
eukprot:s493_g8.t1